MYVLIMGDVMRAICFSPDRGTNVCVCVWKSLCECVCVSMSICTS